MVYKIACTYEVDLKDKRNRMNNELFVAHQITKLTEHEAAQALRMAWKEVFEEEPTLDQLALLWAQSALECGRWKYLHNYNFGNIKAIPGHVFTQFRCDEYINGKRVWFDPPHEATSFCAYLTASAGAAAYIRFLSEKKWYQKAWQQVIAGDPVAYCHALKMAKYYTASEESYTKGVVSLCNEFKKKHADVLEDK